MTKVSWAIRIAGMLSLVFLFEATNYYVLYSDGEGVRGFIHGQRYGWEDLTKLAWGGMVREFWPTAVYISGLAIAAIFPAIVVGFLMIISPRSGFLWHLALAGFSSGALCVALAFSGAMNFAAQNPRGPEYVELGRGAYFWALSSILQVAGSAVSRLYLRSSVQPIPTGAAKDAP